MLLGKVWVLEEVSVYVCDMRLLALFGNLYLDLQSTQINGLRLNSGYPGPLFWVFWWSRYWFHRTPLANSRSSSLGSARKLGVTPWRASKIFYFGYWRPRGPILALRGGYRQAAFVMQGSENFMEDQFSGGRTGIHVHVGRAV